MIAKSFSILFIIILNEIFTDLVDSLYSGHQRFTKNKQNLKCSSSNSLPASTNNFKTKWVQHQLPRSYITVSVLEAADMDYYLEKAIDEELMEPYGLVTWPANIIAIDQLEERFMRGKGLKDKCVCDVGCGTGLTTLTAILLGASRVIALDYNKEALQFTKLSVEKLIQQYPQFSSCVVEYSHFDLTSSTPLPKSDFAVFSDLVYYKNFTKVIANRVYEAMYSGAEALITDPGREERYFFLNELRDLSGANNPYPTSISRESLEVDDKTKTMIKLWILAAKFTSTKISTPSSFLSTKDKDKDKDIKSNSFTGDSSTSSSSSSSTKGPQEKYVSGYYLWL